MILEEKVTGVSNRRSSEDKAVQYSTEIKDAVKSISDICQEDSLEKTTETPNNFQDEFDHIKDIYHSLEQQNTANIDYESLFSYLENKINSPEENYQQETENSEQNSTIMTDEEAEKTVQKIQIGFLTGNTDNISYEEKEKFHKWQEFNKTILMMLYHPSSPIRNDNIDYSRFN